MNFLLPILAVGSAMARSAAEIRAQNQLAATEARNALTADRDAQRAYVQARQQIEGQASQARNETAADLFDLVRSYLRSAATNIAMQASAGVQGRSVQKEHSATAINLQLAEGASAQAFSNFLQQAEDENRVAFQNRLERRSAAVQRIELARAKTISPALGMLQVAATGIGTASQYKWSK